MTIESKNSKTVYKGNGVTTVFPFTFKIWDENQIQVTVEDPQGLTQTKQADKVVITDTGGEVTSYFDTESKTPYPNGYIVALTRNMPFLQKSDYINGTRINTEVLEDDLDKAAAERQQLLDALHRAVMTSPTSDKTPEEILQDFLSRYYEITEKYPEIMLAFNTIYPRIEEILRECIANKDLSKAWAESDVPPDENDEHSKSAKSWSSYTRDVWVELAKAWAESPVPPDPDDPGSKSAKEWAKIASDTVPLASHEMAGKVKIGETVDVDGEGTIDVSQNVLNDIERNGQNIAVLQAEKIDKSAISSAINSASEETVASSKAVSDLRNILSDSHVSGLGMPNPNKSVYIHFTQQDANQNVYNAYFTAPANGWLCIYGETANVNSAWASVSINSGKIRSFCNGTMTGIICATALPVSKGQYYWMHTQECYNIEARFFYAKGE